MEAAAVSRKVFVGGLPCSYPSSHIEDNLFNLFRVFGALTITWPGKKHFGGGKDIKGYVFLLFEEEASVHRLLSVCKTCERGLYYIEVTFLDGGVRTHGGRQLQHNTGPQVPIGGAGGRQRDLHQQQPQQLETETQQQRAAHKQHLQQQQQPQQPGQQVLHHHHPQHQHHHHQQQQLQQHPGVLSQQQQQQLHLQQQQQQQQPQHQKKRLHIQPWFLRDRWVFIDEPSELQHRKTIFVGGVPRCIKAGDLALKLEETFPGVRYVGLDVDREFLFPKGAARATFFTGEAHRAALKTRFLSFAYSDHRGQERKKVLEIKPYIVDEMDCDECSRFTTDLRADNVLLPPPPPPPSSRAVLFCPHLSCLSYLCMPCFLRLHPLSDRELASHRPLSKDPKVRIEE